MDDKSNSRAALEAELSFPRGRVTVSLCPGFQPFKLRLYNVVVLLKLLIAFSFTDTERTAFALHMHQHFDDDNKIQGFPVPLSRVCPPIPPGQSRHLSLPFLHVQSTQVSPKRRCHAESRGVRVAGTYYL